jgi:pSer/pThr/pTyr-binding forkhead associated (FHA) protein
MSDDLGPGGAVIAGATIRVNGREFPWQPGTVITVGRDPTCDVVIDNPRVSRRHLSIEATADGAWLLRDLGSRNGVFVAGHKVDSAALREPLVAVVATAGDRGRAGAHRTGGHRARPGALLARA